MGANETKLLRGCSILFSRRNLSAVSSVRLLRERTPRNPKKPQNKTAVFYTFTSISYLVFYSFQLMPPHRRSYPHGTQGRTSPNIVPVRRPSPYWSRFVPAQDYSVMEPDSIARTSHLERLPPELIRAILSQLSGLAALRCAILSCPLFLNSFTGSSSAIATRVFLNELDLCDVRPEAVAALLASRFAKPTRSSAHEFYKAHLQKRNLEVYIRLTLNEVAELSRLHSAVSRLAKDFADASLQELVATVKDGHTSQLQSQPLELSRLERHRIMRTLYILEIFFIVFRQTSMLDEECGQCMNDFLLNFAPWEIEQIACVQDFLSIQVSPSTGAGMSKV